MSGAYGAASTDVSFRRTWDSEKYAEKAREQASCAPSVCQLPPADLAGKKPPKRTAKDLPKPTETAKAREELELTKDLNKTVIVANPGGRGPGQPGYYCDVCNRTYRDSASYLNHLNSRSHLRTLGQTTRVARSTLDQVRAKIADLRAKSAEATKAKQYDFEQRLREIKRAEADDKDAKKAKRKEAIQAAKQAAMQEGQDEDVAAQMGFGAFGTGKKR
ncbi:uncharacterized protein L969DRAFT_19326 [Mixia osmundae IAM 14324]|uniref:uncharacterized protein n=1 Tax=Mixia osmundae (strain CBS 9802 / IAM 14324 / JCM 22182 / KY 12970) TaxID=764103 RepID=UPI0004A55317|nr:uncharacterized protein L969DRAFT_19326 [Mixia osmundae IAM 14324]KEI37279.1 hypothetical protein L969DRAFT_19326 [Mixia osmundae IAM 14324]